jgi:hypothetical protein
MKRLIDKRVYSYQFAVGQYLPEADVLLPTENRKPATLIIGKLIDFIIKYLKVPDVINAFKANCYFSGN